VGVMRLDDLRMCHDGHGGASVEGFGGICMSTNIFSSSWSGVGESFSFVDR